jgi:hypothetical protein
MSVSIEHTEKTGFEFLKNMSTRPSLLAFDIIIGAIRYVQG